MHSGLGDHIHKADQDVIDVGISCRGDRRFDQRIEVECTLQPDHFAQGILFTLIGKVDVQVIIRYFAILMLRRSFLSFLML